MTLRELIIPKNLHFFQKKNCMLTSFKKMYIIPIAEKVFILLQINYVSTELASESTIRPQRCVFSTLRATLCVKRYTLNFLNLLCIKDAYRCALSCICKYCRIFLVRLFMRYHGNVKTFNYVPNSSVLLIPKIVHFLSYKSFFFIYNKKNNS